MPETILTILIIAHNPEDRGLFRGYLSQADNPRYELVEEALGSQGLAAALNLNPAGILVDEQLPDMAGLEFLAQLQQQSGLSAWPVVLLVAAGNEGTASQALSQGFQDYLVKGQTSPENLRRVVAKAIERTALLRQVEQQRRELAEKNRELEAALHQERAERQRTEAALRQSEWRHRSLFDNNLDPIFSLDAEGHFLAANAAAEQVSGYILEELQALHFLRLCPPEGREEAAQVFRNALCRQCRDFETVMVRKDGTQVDLFITGAPVIVDGEVVGVSCIARDITTRKAADRALRESEERLRLAQDAAQMGTWEYALQTGGATWSDSLWRLLGLPPVEPWTAPERWLNLIHPDDRERASQAIVQALASAEEYADEYRIVRPDDSVVWLLSRARITRDAQGQAVRVLGVNIDITERKWTEEALREGEQMLALAMRGGRMGAWWRDIATNAVWWSPELEELFGLGPNGFSGTEAGFYDFVYAEDRPLIAQRVEQAIAEQRDYLVEFRFHHADGSLRWMEGRGRAVYSPEGQPLRLYGIGIDITERKEAEEALRQAHNELEQRVVERTAELEHSLQELNQFTYVASHDLKAPLRAVKNLASWISADTADILPESSKTHLDKLQNRIERMEKFLDDLLVYSRVGRYYYQRVENIDPIALVREMIDSLAPPPGFTITVQPEMPVLRSQRILLEIVFKNLLDNALKHHHRPEGQIQISARELDSFIEFSVTDDGPGIDPMFHERIFQIFQTLRPRDEFEATGAGLAIVKKAVEGQGGAIQVISAEGQGATFRFTWPKDSDINS